MENIFDYEKITSINAAIKQYFDFGESFTISSFDAKFLEKISA